MKEEAEASAAGEEMGSPFMDEDDDLIDYDDEDDDDDEEEGEDDDDEGEEDEEEEEETTLPPDGTGRAPRAFINTRRRFRCEICETSRDAPIE